MKNRKSKVVEVDTFKQELLALQRVCEETKNASFSLSYVKTKGFWVIHFPNWPDAIKITDADLLMCVIKALSFVHNNRQPKNPIRELYEPREELLPTYVNVGTCEQGIPIGNCITCGSNGVDTSTHKCDPNDIKKVKSYEI